MSGLPCLTLWQPWASLCVLPGEGGRAVKWIETRSWPAPESLIGQRIGIHAAKRHPVVGPIGNWYAWAEGRHAWRLYDDHGPDLHPLPLGALLGTVRLDACVPMVESGPTDTAAVAALRRDGGVVVAPHAVAAAYYRPGIGPRELSVDVTDQTPFGDFAPGRFAWLLSDPQPTTERCPACDGKGWITCVCHQDGCRRTCPTCETAGRCDPIPARGRQKVWTWRPGDGAS